MLSDEGKKGGRKEGREGRGERKRKERRRREEKKKGGDFDGWLDMRRNKQRSPVWLESGRLTWLYDFSLLSEKEKQKGEFSWEQDGYVLLKINCI